MANEWILVVGTLSGTVIGAAATYLVNSFNQRRAAEEAREHRSRERLEESYKLLIQIERDYRSMWAQALQKLKMNIDFEPYQGKDIHPIEKLEMLVKLYHSKELAVEYDAFTKEKESMGTIYTTIAIDGKTKYSVDEMIDIVTAGHDRLVGKLHALQDKISQVIKA